MYCIYCGMRLEDGMLYCPYCGTKVVRIEGGAVADSGSIDAVGENMAAVLPESVAVPEEPVAAEREKVSEESAVSENGVTLKEALGPDGVDWLEKYDGIERRFITGICCFCLILPLLMCSLSGALRLSYSEKKIDALLGKISVRETAFPSLYSAEEISLVDFLEEASGFDFENTAGISKKDLEILLEKQYFKDFLSTYLKSYSRFFFTGEEPLAFTRDDLVEFLKEHDDDFCEIIKFRFTYPNPKTKERVMYTVDIDNAFRDLGTDKVTLQWVEWKLGVNFKPVVRFLCIPLLILTSVLSIFFTVVILLINGKERATGFLVNGIVYAAIGFAFDAFSLGNLVGLAGTRGNILYLMESPFHKNVMIFGTVYLIFGIVMLVNAGAVLNKRKNMNQKRRETGYDKHPETAGNI